MEPKLRASLYPDLNTKARRWLIQFFAWVLAATIFILSIVPPGLRPETGLPHNFEHFIINVVTGLLFGLGYPRWLKLLCTFLVGFAGIVELAQLFVAGRHARLSDFIVDSVALCVGVLFSVVVFRWLSLMRS